MKRIHEDHDKAFLSAHVAPIAPLVRRLLPVCELFHGNKFTHVNEIPIARSKDQLEGKGTIRPDGLAVRKTILIFEKRKVIVNSATQTNSWLV